MISIRKPAVNSAILVKDTDYTLSYRNDIAFGTATATGIGKYKDTISCDYMIMDIIPVYRLFNRKTSKHLYTASTSERQQYLNVGY